MQELFMISILTVTLTAAWVMCVMSLSFSSTTKRCVIILGGILALVELAIYCLTRSAFMYIASAEIGLFGITIGYLIIDVGSKGKRQRDVSNSAVVRYRVYITGDKHREFSKVKKFCKKKRTSPNDVMIILGDSGLNYHLDERDDKLKRKLEKLGITFFCVHGNKECRAQNIGTYGVKSFWGGKVLYEPKYPTILFAIDGEIYFIGGKKYIVVGGAHSVDKNRCIIWGQPFWDDEMPDETIKKKVEHALDEEKQKVSGVLTHTCPEKYIPKEMFLSVTRNPDQCDVANDDTRNPMIPLDIDHSTEEWLGKIETALDYQVWYCGHYHIDKQIDKIIMLYKDIRLLCVDERME